MRTRALLFTISAAFSPWVQAAIVCPDAVRIAYAESELPPYILGTGQDFKDPPGLFVVWARAALAKVGCSQVLQEKRLPYHRIIAGMKSGDIDIRVSAGYRDSMVLIAQYPTLNGKVDPRLAIAEGNTSLYVVKGSRALQWNGTSVTSRQGVPTIGTVLGHFSDLVVRDRQWKVDAATSWESNVKKLLLGRVSAIAGTASVIDALPERDKLQKLEPPVVSDFFFAPVSNTFYAAYPEFTQQFWYEICFQSRYYFRDLPSCVKK